MARIPKMITAALATAAAAAALVACGGGGSSDTGGEGFTVDPEAKIEGQTIKVLMPYEVPKALLDEFTAETGVEVDYQTAGWDALASKLGVANQAGTYIADVTEFDWSWTGQAGANGWYEPLDEALEPAVITDLGPTNSSFVYQGKQMAACYSNDFRIANYNEAMLKEAGVTFPDTFSELETALDALAAKGVADNPMTLPMAASEGSVTPWYLFTLAMGGELFNDKNEPVFNEPGSAGVKALEFEIKALEEGWVSPGSVSQDDGPAFERMTGGAAAIYLPSSPGNLVSANDPKESAVAGDIRAGLMPGESGPGASFGLQEGLAIPVTAEHKDAAVAFIDWWQQPQVQVAMYKEAGFLPCGKTALDELTEAGELEDGAVVSEQFDLVEPLFPEGAPAWYSQFTTEAQGLLNAAFTGNLEPQDALDKLAAKAEELRQDAE